MNKIKSQLGNLNFRKGTSFSYIVHDFDLVSKCASFLKSMNICPCCSGDDTSYIVCLRNGHHKKDFG